MHGVLMGIGSIIYGQKNRCALFVHENIHGSMFKILLICHSVSVICKLSLSHYYIF